MLRGGCADWQTPFESWRIRYTKWCGLFAASFTDLMGFTCMLSVECTSVLQGPWSATFAGWDTNRRCRSHVKGAALAARAAFQQSIGSALCADLTSNVGCTSFRAVP